MSNKAILGLVVVLVALGLVVAAWQYLDSSAVVLPPDDGVITSIPTLPILESPAPNSLVTSPLIVRGAAPGNWFFEANLPVRLTDAMGQVLVETGAQAQGDWMTTDYVPFVATLEFSVPTTTASGFIVVAKDNPSGLPENDAAIQFPVRF